MAASQTTAPTGASAEFPPFDPALFSSQVFWFTLAFGALYFVLSTIIIPRVAKTLAHRRATIDGDLRVAAEETAAAQAARAQAEKAAADAKAQARLTVDAMRATNEADAAKAQAQASANANAKIEQAEAEIATMRASALAGVQESVGELASEIVERITGKKPTQKNVDTALKNFNTLGAA